MLGWGTLPDEKFIIKNRKASYKIFEFLEFFQFQNDIKIWNWFVYMKDKVGIKLLFSSLYGYPVDAVIV